MVPDEKLFFCRAPLVPSNSFGCVSKSNLVGVEINVSRLIQQYQYNDKVHIFHPEEEIFFPILYYQLLMLLTDHRFYQKSVRMNRYN